MTQNPKAVPVETGDYIGSLGSPGGPGGGINIPRKQQSEKAIISALKQYESGDETANTRRKLL